MCSTTSSNMQIFRNGQFLINIMDVIEETGLSSVLKAKIKNRPDLGKDERYGRRVLFEMNKAYPVVMSPMLDKDTLKGYFLEYLSYYYDSSMEVKKLRKMTRTIDPKGIGNRRDGYGAYI